MARFCQRNSESYLAAKEKLYTHTYAQPTLTQTLLWKNNGTHRHPPKALANCPCGSLKLHTLEETTENPVPDVRPTCGKLLI